MRLAYQLADLPVEARPARIERSAAESQSFDGSPDTTVQVTILKVAGVAAQVPDGGQERPWSPPGDHLAPS
jgi:hypothetical protein